VAGVGNNISALVQGISHYRELVRSGSDEPLPGIRQRVVGGFDVTDVRVVAAFDVDLNKVGRDLAEAIFVPPTNYPRLAVDLPRQGVTVSPGISDEATAGEASRLAHQLRDTGAEVLLYGLPTGLQWAADAYWSAARQAGVAFVNCTPEVVARNAETLDAARACGVVLLGDDLKSHLGTSIVHGELLGLLSRRGITVSSSYQLNMGGNEDFRNLRERGQGKVSTKLEALADAGVDSRRITVIPSAGYVPQLQDRKVAIVNVEGVGWAGTPVSIDLTLRVQDSSNAAGVIIDLVRIAAAGHRAGSAGYLAEASPFLKAPPTTRALAVPSPDLAPANGARSGSEGHR
jgi:myo-inositol-1-phosphate synthase